jgi:hypothetical protein
MFCPISRPASHFEAKKSFVSRTATSCKKRHVYIYVCSYVEAQLFFAAVASAACFSQLKSFFFSLSTVFLQIIKKQFLHSTFYPFSIEHQMDLRRCDGGSVVKELN